jgi:hypothetical protein
MLQNNKMYQAKIVGYGAGVGKNSNKGYFFIDFSVESEVIRWMGSPLKNDGTVNDMFLQQIAESGFDGEKNSLGDMANGIGSSVLNETGEVQVRVAQKQNAIGEMVWSIAWIGVSNTASKEEITKALPPNINDMLKGKFKKAKRDAMGDIPF